MSICFAFYSQQSNLSCSAPPAHSSARNHDVNMNAALGGSCLRERQVEGGKANADCRLISQESRVACKAGCLSSDGFFLSFGSDF